MAGRKPIYDVKSLEIGEKLALSKKTKKWYMHQYAYSYNENHYPKRFKAEWINERAHIIRIA